MRIGPITIRWSKAVEREQHKQEWACKVLDSQIALLTAQKINLEAILERYGLGGASGKAKTPKGAGASI